MMTVIRPLKKSDLSQASELDQLWFGDHGISQTELLRFIEKYPNNTISIFEDDLLKGFSTFEVLIGVGPKDYTGNIPATNGSLLFIQQFTTSTNYSLDDMSYDQTLLNLIEKKAIELGCGEVWEALAVDHPYSKEINGHYDAFGFYDKNGYFHDPSSLLTWKPDGSVSIPCYLFRKKMSTSQCSEVHMC